MENECDCTAMSRPHVEHGFDDVTYPTHPRTNVTDMAGSAEGNPLKDSAGYGPWTELYADGKFHSITPGRKNKGDVQLHAIPWEALQELGKAYAMGGDKYDDYNFRKGFDWSLSYDAMQRHAGAFWNREDDDTESGLHHMAHASWHALTLLFFSLTERGNDDRPT